MSREPNHHNDPSSVLDEVIARQFLSLEHLDLILTDEENFDRHVERLNRHLDDRFQIEIPPRMEMDPPPSTSSNASAHRDSIPGPRVTAQNNNHKAAKLSREDEQRHARRLNFFKLRMIKAVEHAALSKRQRLEYLRDIPCRGHKPEVKAEGKKTGACLACEELGCCPKKKGGQVHTTCKAFNRTRRLLVEKNLFNVRFIAQSYGTYGIPIQDLVQEGNAALIRAVEKFDWRKGVRLQTYAEFWIRQAMERLINASKWMIRVPTYMQQRMRKIRREGKLPIDGTRVSAKEVSKAFKTSPVIARHLIETERGCLSLDSLATKGETVKPADLLADKQNETMLSEEVEYRTISLKNALERLTEQERVILRHRFELDGAEKKTLSDLGKMMNLSRERVRQIEAQTLLKLRRPKMLGFLEPYV